MLYFLEPFGRLIPYFPPNLCRLLHAEYSRNDNVFHQPNSQLGLLLCPLCERLMHFHKRAPWPYNPDTNQLVNYHPQPSLL